MWENPSVADVMQRIPNVMSLLPILSVLFPAFLLQLPNSNITATMLHVGTNKHQIHNSNIKATLPMYISIFTYIFKDHISHPKWGFPEERSSTLNPWPAPDPCHGRFKLTNSTNFLGVPCSKGENNHKAPVRDPKTSCKPRLKDLTWPVKCWSRKGGWNNNRTWGDDMLRAYQNP